MDTPSLRPQHKVHRLDFADGFTAALQGSLHLLHDLVVVLEERPPADVSGRLYGNVNVTVFQNAEILLTHAQSCVDDSRADKSVLVSTKICTEKKSDG